MDDLPALGTGRTNLTNTPQAIEADADWSPVSNMIVFVRRPKDDVKDDCPTGCPPNPPGAEIWVINADGTGLKQLTFRRPARAGTAAPNWSPDGARIAFMCSRRHLCHERRREQPDEFAAPAGVFEGTPNWSPDGKKLLFSRQLGAGQQLWVMNADGTEQTQVTNTDGFNTLASWGLVRVTAP